jgi:HNH endonuclease
MKLTPRERFLAKVCPEPNGGCWLWRGPLSPEGYGWASFESKRFPAHRLGWLLFRGGIAAGLVVCHKCDVRACVNPDHLFLGTHADNMRDMKEKGRKPMGEKHYRAKLTAEQVGRIKAMLSEDRLYMSEIALEFGVSSSTIHSIKSGKNWRGVTSSPLATVKPTESESGPLDQAIQESTISEDDL